MRDKPVTIPGPLVASLIGLLTAARSFTPLHHEAVALLSDLADAVEHAESPASAGSIAAELLESIARACRVELPTEPTLHALRRAREALAGISVEAQVIALPRRPSPDAQRDIAAEVSRQIEHAGGVDVVFIIDGVAREADRRPVAPRVGERVRIGDAALRVADVLHEQTHAVVTLDRVPESPEVAWLREHGLHVPQGGDR